MNNILDSIVFWKRTEYVLAVVNLTTRFFECSTLLYSTLLYSKSHFANGLLPNLVRISNSQFMLEILYSSDQIFNSNNDSSKEFHFWAHMSFLLSHSLSLIWVRLLIFNIWPDDIRSIRNFVLKIAETQNLWIPG
jgi:hypothetical protein